MAQSIQSRCNLADFYPAFEEKYTDSMTRRPSKGQDAAAQVWFTNFPESIPTPKLFPGELVQLKQNRVLAMRGPHDCLIGSLFVTTCRIIFTGSSVDEPSKTREVLEFSEGQSKPVLPAVGTRESANVFRKLMPHGNNSPGLRTATATAADEARQSPRPDHHHHHASFSSSSSSSQQQPQPQQEGAGEAGGGTLTSARNFIRSIRRTLKRKGPGEEDGVGSPALEDGEEVDKSSSESSSVHSLSPLPRARTDVIDFERIPDDTPSLDAQGSDEDEEDFDEPSLKIDEDSSSISDSDSRSSLIRQEISKHLTTSISGRPRISMHAKQQYMNFSILTSPHPRPLVSLNPNKPPIPAPRGAQTPPTLVRNRALMSPTLDVPPLTASYDRDTDSDSEGQVKGRKHFFTYSNNKSSTLTGSDHQPCSAVVATSPSDQTRRQTDSPSMSNVSNGAVPTSTAGQEGERTDLVPKEGEVKNGPPTLSQSSSSSSSQPESPLRPSRAPPLPLRPAPTTPPLDRTPPATRSEPTPGASTSSPASLESSGGPSATRRSDAGPPPQPPQKPSSFSFQDVNGGGEASPRSSSSPRPPSRGGGVRAGRSTEPVPQSLSPYPLFGEDSRTGESSPAVLGNSSHSPTKVVPPPHSFDPAPKSSSDSSQSGNPSIPERLETSDRPCSGPSSSSSDSPSVQARIKELSSYENFWPLAMRSRPVEDTLGISPSLGMERTALTRSLRHQTLLGGSGKESIGSSSMRQSMTLPQSTDFRQFTSVDPVSYSTEMWCYTHSVVQVKHIQSSTPVSDLDIVPGQGIHITCWNFNSLKLFINPRNTYDAERLRKILEEDILKPKLPGRHFAIKYRQGVMVELGARYLSYQHEKGRLAATFSMAEEAKRLGFLSSPLWSVANMSDAQLVVCSSYPDEIIVSRPTPLVDIARAAPFFRENRFPVATWRNCDNGAILFRGAASTGKRGSSASKDEQSLLQQICGCLEGQGDVKLYSFTEKKVDINLKYIANQQQQEAYFYSGVKFVYVDRLPTFKTLKNSFNKLFHLLTRTRGHSGYLSALENSGWLHKVSDLLGHSSEVCALMCEEGLSVLVAYEAGWDITTQVVSLAQLMMDPYFRTMEGFQVLIQKEWLAFGHPFSTRHSSYRDHGEASPVFLQWVDCVWQMTQQCPSAFEFNALFLATLVDHSYSGMFGSFLADNHCDRSKLEETVSFWMFVEICNKRDRRFLNNIYDRNLYPGALYVQFEVHCMQLWTAYYSQMHSASTVPRFEGLGADLQTMMAQYQELRSKVLGLEARVLKEKSSENDVPSNASKSTMSLAESSQYDLLPVVVPGASQGKKEALAVKHRSSRSIGVQNMIDYLKSKGIDADIAYHVELHKTICSGYLVKLGGLVRSWKTRWFVLDINKGLFCYFQDRDAYCNKVNPKGVINLQDFKDVYQTNKDDHLKNNTFQVETPQRTYSIRAPSLPTLQIWMILLAIPLLNQQI